jgi:HAD superfamily hydrolase (TIGR01549 family)
MRELAEAAKQKGVRCYIYTHSGNEVKDYLAKMGLEDAFADMMTASENFPRKPDPTALLALCERNGLDLRESLMIGDRDIDIKVGHNAGMAGCLYDPDNFYDAAVVGAEHNVTALDQIIDLL